jgi:hypothetical protein
MINTTNLVIRRPSPSNNWGDDDDRNPPAFLLGPISAIVFERRKLRRGVNNEDVVAMAEILIPANTPWVGTIRQKDRATWTTTPGGVFSDEEILEVASVSGVEGLEHVKLFIRERGGGAV